MPRVKRAAILLPTTEQTRGHARTPAAIWKHLADFMRELMPRLQRAASAERHQASDRNATRLSGRERRAAPRPAALRLEIARPDASCRTRRVRRRMAARGVPPRALRPPVVAADRRGHVCASAAWRCTPRSA
jgi:hypothetical protein